MWGWIVAIAVVVIVGTRTRRFSLKRIDDRVASLEQIHASRPNGRGVGSISLLSRATRETQVADEAVLPVTVFERLAILGFSDEHVDMFNQPNGQGFTTEQLTVEIPEGTTRILPSLKSVQLGYGRTSGSTLMIEDHHLGFEGVDVDVVEIRRVTATIEVAMLLRDWNGDDQWSGRIGVNLLFLGPLTTPEPIP